MVHPKQYKFADYLQTFARNSAEYWYKDIWKTVGKCVFCDLRDRYVIKELNGIILTANIYPYVTGHLLIIPRRHITHLKELTNIEWETIRMFYYVARKMLKSIYGIGNVWMLYREGQMGDASQKTVDHLHVHVLPYEDGLVEWHYKKINVGAFDMASSFREHEKMMNVLIEKYQSKYQNTENTKTKLKIGNTKKPTTAEPKKKSNIKKKAK